MRGLIDPLLEIDEYGQILNSIKNNSVPISITGPSDSQKAHIACALCEHLNLRGLYIVPNEAQARRLYEDFLFFMGNDVLFLPSKEIMLYDVEARSNESIFERARVMYAITRERYSMVVASAEAILHKVAPVGLFTKNVINLTLSSKVELTDLSAKLTEIGYERNNIVESMGQFAIRGGIIDIFPVNYEQAVRIELFDDEIDSIRHFDTISQRSVDKIEEVTIIPSCDIIYSASRRKPIAESIEKDLNKLGGKLLNSALGQRIRGDIEKILNEHYFPGIDRYIPYIFDSSANLLDYFGMDTIVFIDEGVRVKQRIENILLEHFENCRSLLEKGFILPKSQDTYFDYTDLERRLEKKTVVNLSTLLTGDSPHYKRQKRFDILSKSTGTYQGHIEMLAHDLKNWKNNDYKVIVLSGTRGRGQRLVETLDNEGVGAALAENIPEQLQPGKLVVTRGSLNNGFEYPSAKFVLITDKEVFGREKRQRKTHKKSKDKKINLFTDLAPGDYVVHQSHGIGQYIGIENLLVDNMKRDYIKIRYQGGDSLYIPTNQFDIIQKYIGSEGKTPKLSKLGGSDWLKTKKRVKESLKELAGELIKLYAQRQSIKGYAFSKDTVWQKQFEELFPYQETPDQLKCIEDVKRNMESDQVMDRLLCGDVGYGKTEVAIRAIFKAVMDGKQAAYLVPTTVLAQQHFENFKERFKDFPVTVEVISRFRTAAEQRKILKNVKSGITDVLIGTHRLIQKDIKFKDLGLLIVDEEQRFGVSHKEKLKNLKPNVDVLTLTATPIPRTLHMSLVGIRDISVLEDPPEERYPVQTYVMEYNNDVIRDAIYRELGREGQVFYLYNRVRTIDTKASDIKNLVPEARVAVAHGQMDEKQLENIMYDFINCKYDVLVCTTIIESGLDMPNVNTIIVEDADKMGLSQLYQLRGRVGRSNRLAYAYITYKKDKVITEAAEKRLQAIKEFTEFGSGFKIAMRDLEIRGTGNLLGPEQHGHMESVGYDMYCKLLDEAVKELKGEPASHEENEFSIDISLDAFIDNSYISVEGQKIEMYKKIASIQDEQDVEDVRDELIDRFGDIPEPVENLISIAHIKALARQAGLASISEKKGMVIFQFAKSRKISVEAVGRLVAEHKRKILFNAGTNPYFMYKVSDMNKKKLLDNIKIVLHNMKSFEV
ncbi:MAG: transcription-repair coupling factor [Acetivibrionales bacterium]|jgi:transcription-repair coupling factor (superfamily II helicase)